jgi:hypothetical protein
MPDGRRPKAARQRSKHVLMGGTRPPPRFHFAMTTGSRLRRSYLRASTSFQGRPLTRGVLTAGALLALAPLARLANSVTSRRDPSIFEGTWTSLMMVFMVGGRLDRSALSEPTGRHPRPKSADE